MPSVILTGIKPTGSPHIGNYIGAIGPALKYGDAPDWTPVYFIADYHALTTIHDAATLRRLSYEVAATWLAFGLDPDRALFYRQSHVPEIFELTWVLSCFTAKGLMNRAHAYKAAIARNKEAEKDQDFAVDMGLYSYPVLMAADILLFKADIVPVGQDQVQHVEMARDIAQRFNEAYGPVLKLPDNRIQKDVAAIPGLDGRKMSKSYDNTIPLFAASKDLRKLIFRIKTDSTPPGEPKDPEASSIFKIYREIAPADETSALEARFRAGIGWAEAKEALFAALETFLREPRRRYEELMAHPDVIDGILRRGAEKARAEAGLLLAEVRRAVGVD